MKNLGYTILLLLMIAVPGWTVSSFNFLVDNQPVSTVHQGENLVWQVDCAAGASAEFEIWMDLNNNQTLDSADVRLFTYTATDGDSVGMDGPPDIDGVNGFITSTIGPFGFAAISWGFVATEGNTSATGFLTVLPMQFPAATISGTVSFEDGHDPANVLVTTDLDHPPFWNAVTDAAGNYTINLLQAGDYTIGPEYTDSYYIAPQPQQVNASGNVSGVDFSFQTPDCSVQGNILDESGNPVLRTIRMGVMDVVSQNDVAHGEFHDGSYAFGLHPGDYSLGFDNSSLIPEYLAPAAWDNPYYSFSLDSGMTVNKDITLYKADTVLYARILLNGSPLTTPGMVSVGAGNATAGETEGYNDASGIIRLSVKSGYVYWTNLYNDNLPAGYGVPGGTYFENLQPGDTATYNLVNYTQMISGSVSVDPGDPVPDWQRFTAWAEVDHLQVNSKQLDTDATFHMGVPDDTLTVGLWNPSDYLVKPALYDSVFSGDSLTFRANYISARIEGKLLGIDNLSPDMEVWAQTSGAWPDVYTNWSGISPDTSYSLPVCDGEWTVYPPEVPGFVTPPAVRETLLEADTLLVINFIYQPNAIEDPHTDIPQQYELMDNYPNPFNPKTVIPFRLAQSGHVLLEIYNVTGQKVKTVINKQMPAGEHRIQWNASDVPSGVYFYRINTGQFTSVKKMILMK